MVVPEVVSILEARPHIKNVVIFGIEVRVTMTLVSILWPDLQQAQICVLQTTLSLLDLPGNLKVYIVADGVSSTKTGELPLLFDRLRQEGAVVTTSESLGYELVATGSNPKFKAFSQFVKDTKDQTIAAEQVLLLGKTNEES